MLNTPSYMKKSILQLLSFCIWGAMFLLSPACKSTGPQELSTELSTGVPATIGQKTDTGEFGAVVAAHPEASKVGLDILRQGGNAIDAAVAVHFALAVVYPRAGNIGGGGFLVYRDNKSDVLTLDFREKAPAGASRDMFLNETGDADENKSRLGALAAGVPGSVAGMAEAHKKLGTLPWSDLLQPAIKLARDGFSITAWQAYNFNKTRQLFLENNPDTNIPLLKEQAWKPVDKLVQANLAQTLKEIAKYGADGFYKGLVADQIVAQMDTSGGIISKQDLQSYQPVWRTPVSCQFKGHTVYSMAPPSSGGIALCQLLGMIEDYPIGTWGHNQTKTAHLMIEAERRVYADRATHLGDPEYYDVPQNTLVDSAYLKLRMADFDPSRAGTSTRVQAGQIPPSESNETTHYSIVDSSGNAVSVTTTINGAYGAKTMIASAGFLLNNEMDDFSAKPGSPNMFGLVGGEANAIEPEKRMLSSMTPTILTKNGHLYMVLGTPGGSTIITSVFQVINNVINHHMTLPDAVQAPRFHHQWLPEVVYHEKKAFTIQDSINLTTFGHQLKIKDPIGRINAIIIKDTGEIIGAADTRGDDDAQAF